MKSCIEFVTLARKHNRAAINARRDGDTIKRENAVFYRDTCMKSAREEKAKHWLQQEDDKLEQREKAQLELPEPAQPVPSGTTTSDDDPIFKTIYQMGAVIVAFVTFVGSWIWCIGEYGFLLGVGLGWLPSAIVAVIAGALWPLLAAIVLALAYWLYHTGAL